MAADIRILIADDHPILRKGLRQMLEAVPHLRVIGEADDGEAALEQIVAQQPDVVILDIDMPKLDGFGVARELARRRIPSAIIFLTLHASEELFTEAMDLGARGYIPKESALDGDRGGRQGRGGGTVLRDAVAHVAARSASAAARVPCPRVSQASARSPRPSADPEARRRRALEQGHRRAAVRALPDRREPPRQHRAEARPAGPQRRPEVRAPASRRAVEPARRRSRVVTHARTCVRPHADRAERLSSGLARTPIR